MEFPILSSSSPHSAGESLQILLVDDELATIQLVRKILQADGHEVHEAVDGEQAIELFERIQPDLVLLDIVIPKMDGLAVLSEIRRRDPIAGVIMVSALTSEQLAVRSMLAGADDYLSKPFKLKTIRVNIRRVMDKVRLRQRNLLLQAEVDAAHAKLRKVFKLYMTPTLAEELLSNPELPELGGERQQVTVLFMDFCNFTPLAHKLPPDEVLSILNEYLELVTASVPENNGYLDKIMGDGFMALYNSHDSENNAANAVKSAIQMYRKVATWNKAKENGLQIRVGIHTGEAVVGNIGTPELMNFTAIGDTVNLAKRLEEFGDPGDILISGTTYKMLEQFGTDDSAIHYISLGPQVVKGRETPVEIIKVRVCENHL